MYLINEFFSNKIISAGLLSWFVAQFLKVIFTLITDKKIDFSRFVGAGGMPSSHSSLVCTSTILIGRMAGIQSPIFALSLIISLIVMYDASGVRRAAGEQAKIINNIVEALTNHTEINMEEKLKELLGHTPFEVIMGAILGILIGIYYPIY